MMSTIVTQYEKIASPRRKRQRSKEKNTPGGSKSYVEQDEPKKEERTLLQRVEKKLGMRLEPPTVCCGKNCCKDTRINPEIVKYRIAAEAALPPDERRKRIQETISHCRVKVGPNRQVLQYRVPIPGGQLDVCRTFFIYYHNISSNTLNRNLAAVKSLSGLIPEDKMHGNTGKQKPGKGRQACAQWMRMLFDSVAEPKPNQVVIRGGEERTKEFLPSGIFGTLDSVYMYYKSAFAEREASEGPVSYMTFRRAWLQHHFQVKPFPRMC